MAGRQHWRFFDFSFFEITGNVPYSTSFTSIETLRDKYRKCAESNFQLLNGGLDSLEGFITEYNKIVFYSLDSESKNKLDNYIYSFSNIIHAKRVVMYITAYLYKKSSQLWVSINRIVYLWEIIRTSVARYIYQANSDIKNIEKTIPLFNQLLIEERKFIQLSINNEGSKEIG